MVLAGSGLMIAVATPTAIFGPYREQVAAAWFPGDGTMPDHALTWLRYAAGLIGAAVFAQGLMLALALRHAPHERWAQEAMGLSTLAWFVVDSTASIAYGGWFNAAMLNAPAVVAMAVPWWFAWRAHGRPASKPR